MFLFFAGLDVKVSFHTLFLLNKLLTVIPLCYLFFFFFLLWRFSALIINWDCSVVIFQGIYRVSGVKSRVEKLCQVIFENICIKHSKTWHKEVIRTSCKLVSFVAVFGGCHATLPQSEENRIKIIYNVKIVINYLISSPWLTLKSRT